MLIISSRDTLSVFVRFVNYRIDPSEADYLPVFELTWRFDEATQKSYYTIKNKGGKIRKAFLEINEFFRCKDYDTGKQVTGQAVSRFEYQRYDAFVHYDEENSEFTFIENDTYCVPEMLRELNKDYLVTGKLLYGYDPSVYIHIMYTDYKNEFVSRYFMLGGHEAFIEIENGDYWHSYNKEFSISFTNSIPQIAKKIVDEFEKSN